MDVFLQIMVGIVIVGHVIFAVMQAFFWPFVAKRLLKIEDAGAVAQTTTVGKSFASYNLSIAIGLGLSFRLPESVLYDVQLAVMALIVFTAIVGYLGTKSIVILLGRLLPAAISLLLLVSLA